MSVEARHDLANSGIALVEASLDKIALYRDEGVALCFAGCKPLRFDAVYSALGVRPRCELAALAGAKIGDDGRLVVDDHQRTTVDGLFAAGDMVRGLNQISTAQGEAAIAATAIHNFLRQK